MVLDLDGTDDPAHGRQPEMAYHGFYRQHMDYPLLVFDGTTGHLITAVLRPGNVRGSRFVVLVLRRLLKRHRPAWPAVTIEIRADSGFAVPHLYAWCEHHGVTYTTRLVPNRRLVVLAAPLLGPCPAPSRAAARFQHGRRPGGSPCGLDRVHATFEGQRDRLDQQALVKGHGYLEIGAWVAEAHGIQAHDESS